MEYVYCPAEQPKCGGAFRQMGEFYPPIPVCKSVEQVVCVEYIAHIVCMIPVMVPVAIP